MCTLVLYHLVKINAQSFKSYTTYNFVFVAFSYLKKLVKFTLKIYD